LILDRDKELKSSNPNRRTETRNSISISEKYLEEQGYASNQLTRLMDVSEDSTLLFLISSDLLKNI